MSQKDINKSLLLFTLMAVAMGVGCAAADKQSVGTGVVTPTDSEPTEAIISAEGEVKVEITPGATTTGTEPTPTPANPPFTPPSTDPKPTTSPPAKSSFKDGTYSVEGGYLSPGGEETIDVTLTLKNDVVTDATVVSKAFRPNSVRYQGMFISGFKEFVVGKKIADIQLTKVSGSSLTPGGFNDAVGKIKFQAKNS